VSLADYLDLLEPRGLAPAPGTVYRPSEVRLAPIVVAPGSMVSRTAQADADLIAAARRYCGSSGLSLGYTPGVVFDPSRTRAKTPAKYSRSATTTFRSPSRDFTRVLQTGAGAGASAPDPAAEQNRRDCVAMCAANPGSPDCAPDAPGRPGSGGFCAPWLPGGTQATDTGGGGAGACPPGLTWNGTSCVPPVYDPGGGSTPSCPEGSVWNGQECAVPAPPAATTKSSNWGLLFGLAAVAFVARRALMR